MKTIKGKMLFGVISALVVITTLVTSIAVAITHEILHKDADRILNNVSQKEMAQINDMLNDFVKSAAILEHYISHGLDNPESLKEEVYLSEYTEQVRHLFDEIALNTSGTSSYYLCFAPNLTSNSSGFYTKLYADGAVFTLSEEDFSELSLITDEELIAFSNYTGTTNGEWIQPHPSRFTGEEVISYIMPVYKDGMFIAILGFNMNFDYLLDRVNSISVYDYGCALLLGEDNQTIYNQSEKTEFEGEYTSANATLVNGMHLNLRAAYKDIQSGIRYMLNYIIAAFLTVFALALVYTFWVTHRIVTPLKKLTQEAQKITSGVQELNLVVDSDDEVGTLARVLGSTYDKIREYSSYISALAYRDSLTGLKNGTAYYEAILNYNEEINHGNPAFGVIVADINNLKKTNDTYGHDVGNELIIRAAKTLTDTFKTSSVFRIGGDEFAIILKGKDLDQYRARLKKMDAAFALDFISVNEEEIFVSIARGVAIFDPSIDHVYSDVFEKADHAMYMNKEAMKSSL